MIKFSHHMIVATENLKNLNEKCWEQMEKRNTIFHCWEQNVMQFCNTYF
jgi:hypothetical protein